MKEETYFIKAEVYFSVVTDDPRKVIVLADQLLYDQSGIEDWKITEIAHQ